MVWRSLPPLTKDDHAAMRRDRKKARFLVDESVDPAVAEWLRGKGWNAVHAREIGLARHSDEDILAFAHREDRILLTHDAGFLDDRAFPPHRNPGVVVLPGSADSEEFGRALGRVAGIVGTARGLWRQAKIKVGEDDCWSVSTFERDEGRIVTNRYRFRRNRSPEMWVDESD
jgi:hypothetical protein